MSQIEILINRLKCRPTDFTYDELKQILKYFGFVEDNKGKTSGSRVKFQNNYGKSFEMHKPHPKNILKPYQVKVVLKDLYDWGYLDD